MKLLQPASARYTKFPWIIAGLLLLALFINYLDRQTLSVLAPFLPHELRLGNVSYGRIQSFFLLAYSLAMPFAGWIVDRLGTRLGLALAVALWSLIEMLHGTARTVLALGTYRLLLGIPEAAALPSVSKVAAEQAASHTRGTLIGVAMFGVGMGSTLAPPVVAYVALHADWSWAFYCTGIAGMAWVFLWLALYRPEQRPSVPSRVGMSWSDVFHDRRVLGLTLARVFSDSTWWIYLFWIPPLLVRVHSIDLHQFGIVGWIPYFVASIGSVFGGYASGFLVRRGRDPVRSRTAVMWCAAGAVLLAAVTTGVVLQRATIAETLTLLAVATFFIQAFFANIFTLPADLFPPSRVASIFGLNTMAGGLVGFLCVQAVGDIADRFSFAPVFFCLAFFLPVAMLCLVSLVRPSSQAFPADAPAH